ncbi:hypothetical protein JM93_00007 [Roseibium hamelinense]|uniref:Uncharacterized protein n=1 Tax=Roseibium hamelinense TaxID=150831 RepID=A0A562TG37_9HYPH|nr:hypothetical protein [Roseibium hamelinense]TWI92465.1 hypothetical protein JM93_00007 [Roseibium hamelinense]
MKRILSAAVGVLLGFNLAWAQEEPAGPILIENVNVFDGVSEDLIEDASVVITGNIITEISPEPLAVAGGASSMAVDAP